MPEKPAAITDEAEAEDAAEVADPPAKKIATAARAGKPKPVWVVQLASLRTREDAEAQARLLRHKGFKLIIVKSGAWWTVRLPAAKPERGDALAQLSEWRTKTRRNEGLVVEIKHPISAKH